MAELSERLVTAWKQAADELGFRFQTPYHTLTLDHRRVTYLGLVEGFGGSTGTLLRVLNLGELSVFEEIDRTLCVAKLGERHASYDALVFRGTLVTWGWRGLPSARPAWMPASAATREA